MIMMMEVGRDTDPSEHRIYILWCQKPKHPRFGPYFQRSRKSAQLHNRSIINRAIVISGGLTLLYIKLKLKLKRVMKRAIMYNSNILRHPALTLTTVKTNFE